jgi:hypothetical protein
LRETFERDLREKKAICVRNVGAGCIIYIRARLFGCVVVQAQIKAITS